MSLVRAGEDGSDVYVFECDTNLGPALNCCFPMFTGESMANHLLIHRLDGDTVPATGPGLDLRAGR